MARQGDFDDEEPTITDGTPLTESGEITPLEVRRCTDCGNVIFDDAFDEPAAAVASGLFAGKQCMRAHDGHWAYCANYSPTHGKFVYLVPR